MKRKFDLIDFFVALGCVYISFMIFLIVKATSFIG